MVFCCAYGCKSRNDNKDSGITFHRFPTDPQKSSLWVQNMKLADWAPSPMNRLCSKHFEKSMLHKVSDTVCPLDDAVPTIFPEIPLYLQRRTGIASSNSDEDLEHPPNTLDDKANISDANVSKRTILKQKLLQAVSKNQAKTKKIKVLREKVKRFKNKIDSLKNIIKELKSKNLIPSENSLILESMPERTKDLLIRQL